MVGWTAEVKRAHLRAIDLVAGRHYCTDTARFVCYMFTIQCCFYSWRLGNHSLRSVARRRPRAAKRRGRGEHFGCSPRAAESNSDAGRAHCCCECCFGSGVTRECGPSELSRPHGSGEDSGSDRGAHEDSSEGSGSGVDSYFISGSGSSFGVTVRNLKYSGASAFD